MGAWEPTGRLSPLFSLGLCTPSGRGNSCFLGSFAVCLAPLFAVGRTDTDTAFGNDVADSSMPHFLFGINLIRILCVELFQLFDKPVIVRVNTGCIFCLVVEDDGLPFIGSELPRWLSLPKSRA